MPVANIHRYRESDWLHVYFKYEPDLIIDLKNFIPSHARKWDPEERCWVILRSYEERLVFIIEENGHTAEFTEAKGAVSNYSTDPFETLFKEVPADLQQKLFRHLTLALHPDNGGDGELMKRLNIAWGKVPR